MPHNHNGGAPALEPKVDPKLFEAHKVLNDALWEVWKAINDKNKLLDPMNFSRVSTVCLSQMAAIIGVDVGMDKEQFLKVCAANFDEAYAKAPKFA